MYAHIIWNEDPEENVQHVRDNGLEPDEVEYVVASATSHGFSRSSGRPCVWGYTASGDYVQVVYDRIDEITIVVVTAFILGERG